MNMHQLVLNGMKRRRGRTKAMLLAIGIAAALMTGILVTSASQRATSREWTLDSYGKQDLLFYNTTPVDAAALAVDEAVSETARTTITGYILLPDSEDTSLVPAGQMDVAFRNMTRIALISGVWPDSPDEVAVEKDTAAALGLQAGDTAELVYNTLEQESEQALSVKVTGIMENYRGLLWYEADTGKDSANPLPAVILGGEMDNDAASVHIAVALKTEYQDIYTINRLANSVQAQSSFNGSAKAEGISQRVDGVMVGVAAAIGMLMMIMLVHSFSLFAVQRGRELSLLRAVGATTVQLRSMIQTEARLLSAVAVPAGMALGIGFPFIGVAVLNIIGTDAYYFSIPWIYLALLLAAMLLFAAFSADVATRRFHQIAPLNGMKTGDSVVRKTNASSLLRGPQRFITARYFGKNRRLIITAVLCSALSLAVIGGIVFVASLLSGALDIIVADYSISINSRSRSGVIINNKATKYNITNEEGFTDEEIMQMLKLIGVEAVHGSRIDESIVIALTPEQRSDYFDILEFGLSYEGGEWGVFQSEEHRRELMETQVNIGFNSDDLLLDKDISYIGLDDEMLTLLSLDGAQIERMRRGESIIIITPDYVSVLNEKQEINSIFYITESYNYNIIDKQHEGEKTLYTNTSLQTGDMIILSKAIPADHKDSVEIIRKQVTIERMSSTLENSLGLYEYSGKGILILCHNDFLRDWAQTKYYSYLSIYADDIIPAVKTNEQIHTLLAGKPHIDIRSKNEEAEYFHRLSNMVTLIGLFLSLLTAAFSTLMLIGNSSLMLNERRSELGILLAAGMEKRCVRHILYSQISLSVLPGAVLSALLYFLISFVGFKLLLGDVIFSATAPWLWMLAAALVLAGVQCLYLRRQADRFAKTSIVEMIRTIE